jgi:hypothetical protein
MNEASESDDLLDELRGLAEGASLGPWRVGDQIARRVATVVRDAKYPICLATVVRSQDAAFIAAANPATVLALVDELALLRARLDDEGPGVAIRALMGTTWVLQQAVAELIWLGRRPEGWTADQEAEARDGEFVPPSTRPILSLDDMRRSLDAAVDEYYAAAGLDGDWPGWQLFVRAASVLAGIAPPLAEEGISVGVGTSTEGGAAALGAVGTNLAILIGTLDRCPVAFCDVTIAPHHERCPFGALIDAITAVDRAAASPVPGAEGETAP